MPGVTAARTLQKGEHCGFVLCLFCWFLSTFLFLSLFCGFCRHFSSSAVVSGWPRLSLGWEVDIFSLVFRWVEFVHKRDAKRISAMLNGESMGK